jgi:choline dehydrogenase
MERWEGGGDRYRGDSGPIRTARGRYDNPLFEAFIQAGLQMGYSSCADFNGADQEGFAHCQHTHYWWPVMRCSASYGYLLSVRWRRNLVIRKHATVHRMCIENGRATGVVYQRHGKMHAVRASAEVLLCAGPYQSPRLLMLSGIGDADELGSAGIDSIHHLPGVGKNLQDQIGSFIQRQCLLPITYYKYRNPFWAATAIAEWLVLARGPLTLFPMASSGMVKTDDALDRPDVQFYMYPVAVNPHAEGTFMPKSHAYNIHWGVIRPKSRGYVKLRSSDPSASPVIFNNFFGEEEDRITNRKAFRIARELHGQSALESYRGPESAPGPDCTTDDDIDAHTSRYFANHYHASGTCKMGNDDLAVVDHELKVHGIDRLRVVDSSIMPRVVAGGLNAPSMMIGEKASDMILAEHPL